MEEGLFQPKNNDGVIMGGCGLGVSHLSVLANGTVYACRRFNSPVGDAKHESLHDIFMSPTMDVYRDYSQMKKCRDCKLLSYCRGCMAVTHGSTEDWTQADPQCWK